MKRLLLILVAMAAMILPQASPAYADTYIGKWQGHNIYCWRPITPSNGDCVNAAYWTEIWRGYSDYLYPNRTCALLRHNGKGWRLANGAAYFAQSSPTQQIGYAYPC